jgi:beta-glucosidase
MVNFATDIRVGDFGSSRVQPDPAKTTGPLAGIQAIASTKGITVVSGNSATAVADADFVVVVAGLTFEDEGEEYTGAADRPNFGLDGKRGGTLQDSLIEAVANLNKPMVVVLEGGSVIETPWIAKVPALVTAWYPGQAGGAAIAQLLFGTDGTNPVNFSGKLPITWSTTGWPTFNEGTSTTMAYHLGYRRFDAMNIALNPAMGQYPFGHGLSYTTYRYENVQVPCSDVTKTGVVNVTVDVHNTGTAKGTEVAFLWVTYVDPAPTGVMRSIKELKGFYRVDLDPGQGKRITIPLRASDLKVYSPTTKKMEVYSGRVKVMVGPSADRTKLLPTSDTDTSTTFTVLP